MNQRITNVHRPCPHALLAALFLEILITGTSSAQQWPIEAVYSAKDKILIPIGKSVTTHALDLPAFQRREGKRVCMRFKAYLASPKPAGWSRILTITINDRSLGPSVATGENRVINRGLWCETKQGPLYWWGPNLRGDDALLTLIGPGDALDSRILQPRDEPYEYILDVSDAVQYIEIGADQRIESARPNRIGWSNTYLRKYSKNGPQIEPLTIEGLTLGYLPEELVRRQQRSTLVTYSGKKEKERIVADGFTAIVTESTGIRIDTGGDRYFIASSFSYPGRRIGYNRLDPDTLAGEAGWKPRIHKVDEKTVRIEAESQQYHLTRTLSLREGKLRVTDQFTNKTDAPIGVQIGNSLAIPGFPRPASFFLGGRENHSSPIVSTAENPTVFVAQEHSSLGIVAEDNIYRLQLNLVRRTNVFDMTAGHFGLVGHKAYTFEWTIYPRSHRDYWAFINEVRRDWKVNFTVLGPFIFGDMGKGDTLDYLYPVAPEQAAFGGLERKRKTQIMAIGPWIDFNDGAAITREQYKTTWSKVVAKLRQADPNLIVMPKVENNVRTSTSERLPADRSCRTPSGPKEDNTAWR